MTASCLGPKGAGRLLLGFGLVLAAGQGVAQQREIPPAQIGGQVAPPVEITASMAGGAARCEPAEARLPAQEAIDLRVVNRTDQNLTIAAPLIFSDEYLIRFEGEMAHAASNRGYVVKPNGIGRILLRTPPPGDYPFTCAGTGSQGSPFQGKLTIVPKAG